MIQRCTPDQIEALTTFYDKVKDHLYNTINYPKWTDDYPNRASITAAVSAGYQYAYTEDSVLLGAFVLNEDPDNEYPLNLWQCQLQKGEFLTIHTLAVDPQATHRGIASKMTDFCIAKAKAEGYQAVRVDAVPTNTPARNLYEKAGFVCCGTHAIRTIPEIPMFTLYELSLAESEPAFRPMRRAFKALSEEAVQHLLTTSRRGILAVNGDNGYPYAIPVNYWYNATTNKVYFHGSRVGHKIDAIQRCNKVCFTVYGNETIKEEAWAPYLQSVVLFGRCRLITDQDEAYALLKQFARRFYPSEILVEEEIARSGKATQMYEITIEHCTGKEVQEK